MHTPEEEFDQSEPAIIVNQQAPGDLSIGDYVYASRWSDCDPCDPWAVGKVTELGNNYVIIGEFSDRQWPKAMKITLEQGRRIIQEYPPMEAKRISLDYKVIERVFNGK